MESNFLLQNYGERDFKIVKGQGSWVWDEKGDRYLDCVSGIAVNAFGHGYEPVIAAIKSQLDLYLHASNLYLMQPQVELAKVLCETLGFAKAFFCNSGTEANEGAIKIARRYWLSQAGIPGHESKIEIITLASSFHGRTYGSMAATGQAKIRNGFGPLPEGFIHVPVNDVRALKEAVSEKTAAILFEPVLAEGGIISLSPEFVLALNQIQSKGVILIADEIQAGLGRTGAWLASKAMGIIADMVALAKPLGGGLPLGAVLMRENIASAIKAGDHGSTFGGNPVSCAAGLAVMKELAREGFLDDIKTRADLLKSRLEALVEKKSSQGIVCGPILGKGFLIGFRYGGDLTALVTECRVQKLLVHRAGTDVLRLLPPLNISTEEIKELIERLDRAMIIPGKNGNAPAT